MTTDTSAFSRALSELRFSDAEAILDDVDGDLRQRLASELEERRRAADWRARELHRRILDLGVARDYRALMEIRRRPDTDTLLELLSDGARQRAVVFFRNAERWAEGRRAANDRRLIEARAALDGLDLQLAGGLLSRIEDEFLDDQGVERRDQLLTDLTARRMEFEDLRSIDEQVGDGTADPDTRPWWRRWLG